MMIFIQKQNKSLQNSMYVLSDVVYVRHFTISVAYRKTAV